MGEQPPDTPLGRRGALPSDRQATEHSGRTVEEAVELALLALRVERTEVEVEVLDEGSRGVLGLRSREARIRVRPKRIMGSRVASVVQGVAQELIGLMGFGAAVVADEGTDSVRVAAEGTNLAALIGKHGQTLAALEAVMGMIVGRRLGAPVRIELDVMGYRQRRRAALEALAQRTAERVARSGRESALSPMDARDRRVIHLALQEHPDVTTASRGEGEVRRVVVIPRAETPVLRRAKETNAGTKGPPPEKGRTTATGTNERDRSASSVRQDRRTSNQSGRWTVGGRSGRVPDRFPPSGRGSPARGQGRRASVPGGVAPRARPEGLPSDEELEAEIQAHLEKMARPSGEGAEQSAPEENVKAAPEPENQGEAEQ